MTRDDVLKEFVDCRCSYVCECYEFVYEAMADEIVALRAEREALRKVVESAYREGFWDGEGAVERHIGYGDTAWWMSDARKALEVQP